MYLLKSRTTPVPTALPAIDVPAPRAVSGTPSARHTANTAATSSALRGAGDQKGRHPVQRRVRGIHGTGGAVGAHIADSGCGEMTGKRLGIRHA